MTTIDDEDRAHDAQDGARRAYATNFGFVQRLAQILGRDAIEPERREEIGRWLALVIDGSDGVVDAAIEHDAMTAEVVATAVAAMARAGRQVTILRRADRPTVVLPFKRPTR